MRERPNRPLLEALIDFARDGDTVLVHSMDRLARNLDDVRSIVPHRTDMRVQVRSVKENLTFTEMTPRRPRSDVP